MPLAMCASRAEFSRAERSQLERGELYSGQVNSFNVHSLIYILPAAAAGWPAIVVSCGLSVVVAETEAEAEADGGSCCCCCSWLATLDAFSPHEQSAV